MRHAIILVSLHTTLANLQVNLIVFRTK